MVPYLPISHQIVTSGQYLVPFFFLSLLFLVIFAAIGHLLYGGVLLEWSTFGYAIMTAFDLIMGNYIFAQLETGLDPEDSGGIFVAVFYFYLYFLLMMLVVMNIVISILMDGYNSVK